ncbi:hypothetical protein GJW-30_1_01465 [Variibacter gotjawalensis]|uniref:Uncharacterized protein n=1 Tax=Variibacter gotjawalensis TaxID=1333996 RepID=A0A0S3PSP3_9BRAD|nr:hypothetical protein [Variibacter gotjawalensis]RZS51102.1 hypothetical protein EV661_3576 [Variibacter gotjawalensis]BAT58937.1 hypothetical protein GJW-30_1_01465 [Variibacter gotjawalensis]
MVDKTRLQLIGWLLGSTTAIVFLVAAVMVSDAVASRF